MPMLREESVLSDDAIRAIQLRDNVSWVGFDFDGTLAEYKVGTYHAGKLGRPIMSICRLAVHYLKRGSQVRIFTARVSPANMCFFPNDSIHPYEDADARTLEVLRNVKAIREWSLAYLGFMVPVTNLKDHNMTRVYDDRAVQVLANKGVIVGAPNV